jgi:tetratricopeptide (TPR) repeat protein
MESTYEEALARLNAGESLGTLLASLRSPSELSVQRGAALVRWFDRDTFEVFAPGSDFAAFVKEPFVEPVPGREGTYRVHGDYRQTVLQGWDSVDEQRDLNAKLVAFFHGRTPGGSADELFHLSALGPPSENETRRLLLQLFDEADRAFDLSICTELVDLVSLPAHRHSPTFTDTVKDVRCRLRSRQLWSEEYFRTTAYHERQPLVDGLEALLEAKNQWMLQLVAVGGMGKTMFVRWMLARYLVPKRVPCARLDFTFEQPSLLKQSPWRLVLKVARQLNAQMPETPFTELVKEYGDAEAEVERTSEDGTQDVSRSRLYDKKYNDDGFVRLGDGLIQSRSTTPVIVFDTLERVSLYYQEDLLSLIGRLADVQSNDKPLLLVLAGRYNLAENDHIPGFAARYGGQTLTLPILPFTAAEGRHYLTMCRGLADDGRATAIVDRSDGVPFKLSLFATLVQDDDKLDETAIRQMTNVNVEYLIKRVVDQIKEPLIQWVLRHGVVPRQLTKTFLRDVMLPLLHDVQRGESTLDSGLDELPAHLQNPERFQRGLLKNATDTIELDDVWTKLNRYAAGYSWISQSTDWPDTLVFHADVIAAMRVLLQQQPIFDRLHADAIRYYEALAADEPAHWTRWTREALFHRFQKGGAEAPAAWQDALRESARDAAARRDIAAEVLGPEYVDEAGGPRLRKDGSPMVTRELLLSANYEAACAGIEEARLRRAASGDQGWFTAERRLREAQRIQDALAVKMLTPIALAVPTAGLELLRNPEGALHILDGARKDVTPDVASEFEELYGDALRSRDVQAASQHYITAFDLAGPPALREARVRHLALKLVETAARTGNYEVAIAVGQRALSAADAADDWTGGGEIRVRLAESLLAAGQVDSAISVSRERPAGAPEWPDGVRASLDAVEARGQLALGDPLRGWRFARRRFRHAFDSQIEEPSFTDATGLEVKAEIHAALFEFDEALAAWREARRAWDVLHDAEATLRCVLQCVRILVRQTRRAAEAGQMMGEAERTAASLGVDTGLAFTLVEVERLAAIEPEQAASMLDTMMGMPNLAASVEPRVTIAAAKQALVMGHRVPETAALLAAALQRISPPQARISLLNPRERPIAASDAVATALGPLLLPAMEGLARGERRVTALLLDALESLRWLGQSQRAQDLFHHLDDRLTDGESLFNLLPLREALARMSLDIEPDLNAPSLSRKFLQEFDDRPRVCAVFLLSETEIRIARDKWRPNKFTLTQIDHYIGERSSLPASLLARVNDVNKAAAKSRRAKPPAGTGSSSTSGNVQPALPPPTELAPLAPPEPPIVPQRPSITITFGRTDEQSVITRNGSKWLERPIGQAFRALVGASIEELTKTGLAAPVLMDRRLATDPSAAAEIGRLLLDEEWLSGLAEPIDLRIETPHSLLGGIPWELARLPGSTASLLYDHPRVRCLYRSASGVASQRFLVATVQAALRALIDPSLLVDDVLGPNTRAALIAFQSTHGLPATGSIDAATLAALAAARSDLEGPPPKSVVIVRRSQRAQETDGRGGSITGFDIEYEYKNAGWQTTVLEDPTRAMISRALAQSRAQLLHVNASIAENTRTGGLYLEVGRSVDETNLPSQSVSKVRRTQGLPVGDLIECLRSPAGSVVAALILDPPAVPTYTEAVRQLILRNAFASDAFQLATVPAIVAMGLVQGSEYYEVATALVAGLDAGQPLNEVCARMRRVAHIDPRYLVSLACATALFSHSADYALPATGSAAAR